MLERLGVGMSTENCKWNAYSYATAMLDESVVTYEWTVEVGTLNVGVHAWKTVSNGHTSYTDSVFAKESTLS